LKGRCFAAIEKGTIGFRIDWIADLFRSESVMTEDVPPLFVEAIDVTDDDKTIVEKASESVQEVAAGVKTAASHVGAAYQKARKPGMPLSILANVAREAPLGSLLVAFLLGVAVARRR
jgi:hypothetical protein